MLASHTVLQLGSPLLFGRVKEAMSSCLPPLRTARDGFRSSLLQRDKVLTSMDVLVTCSMKVDQVVRYINAVSRTMRSEVRYSLGGLAGCTQSLPPVLDGD